MSGLPIEPVERDHQPFFRRSPEDVRGLDHGVLQMRGDNLDVFLIKRNELETIHDPAFDFEHWTEGRKAFRQAQG